MLQILNQFKVHQWEKGTYNYYKINIPVPRKKYTSRWTQNTARWNILPFYVLINKYESIDFDRFGVRI